MRSSSWRYPALRVVSASWTPQAASSQAASSWGRRLHHLHLQLHVCVGFRAPVLLPLSLSLPLRLLLLLLMPLGTTVCWSATFCPYDLLSWMVQEVSRKQPL